MSTECPKHGDAVECAHHYGYAAAIRRRGSGYRVEVTDRQGEMTLPGTMSRERAGGALRAWMEAAAVDWGCQAGT